MWVKKVTRTDHCRCCEGDACICASKTPQLVADESPRMSTGKSSAPSTTLSLADSSRPGATDIAHSSLQPDFTESVGTAHQSIENNTTHSVLSHTGLDSWPFDSLIDTSTLSPDDRLTDFATLDTQDWLEALDPLTGIDINQSAHVAIPTFDDPLSTIDLSSLEDIFRDLPQEELFHIDSGQLTISGDWDPLDFMVQNNGDSEQWSSQF